MTVGSRPQVVNQILQLRKAGCFCIVVVTSPSTDQQIRDVIQRAGLTGIACTTVQEKARGPVDALMCGLLADATDHKRPTYVLMSDTVLDEPLPHEGDWVGVSYDYDQSRSWCYVVKRRFIDGRRLSEDPVTIGAYRFDDTVLAYSIAARTMFERYTDKEVGMSHFLNRYNIIHPLTRQDFSSWLDVGDVASLAAAKHKKFNGRAKHSLVLDRDGLIHKTGVNAREIDFYDSLGERGIDVQSLFPTYYRSDRVLLRYTMEYIDMPTLAELWLYWPGLPETWASIVQSLVDRLNRSLWQKRKDEPIEEFTAGDWLAVKAAERLDWFMPEHRLTEMLTDLGDVVGEDIWVDGHGDLNFTNILFSINTGNFKLIDPRGGSIPLIYEYAKLAYSHIFSAITHGLFITFNDGDGNTWILPHRTEEVMAINNVLLQYVDEQRLTAAVALTLLAAPPLHAPDEGKVLFDLGVQMGRDVLNGD